MQTTETTVVEIKTSIDEVNNILVAFIQKQNGVRVDKIDVQKDGVIIITGTKSKDLTNQEMLANLSEGDSLAASILRTAKGKTGSSRTGRTREGSEIHDFIRQEMKNAGGQINIDDLVKSYKAKGFGYPYKSNIQIILKKSAFGRNEVEQVDENTYRLKTDTSNTEVNS